VTPSGCQQGLGHRRPSGRIRGTTSGLKFGDKQAPDRRKSSKHIMNNTTVTSTTGFMGPNRLCTRYHGCPPPD
jgi:hypothetical protein